MENRMEERHALGCQTPYPSYVFLLHALDWDLDLFSSEEKLGILVWGDRG